MRRKEGSLVPLELSILSTAVAMRLARAESFHGHAIAREMQANDGRRLAAQGTLYRALARLEDRGLLESEWEDPAVALSERRPLRRLYTVTAAGQKATAEAARGNERPLLELRSQESDA